MSCCFSSKSKPQNIPFLEKYEPIFEKIYDLDNLQNKNFIQEGSVIIDEQSYQSELYTDYLVIKHKTKKVFRVVNLLENNKLKQISCNKLFYKELFDIDFKSSDRQTIGLILIKGLNTLKNEGSDTKKEATKQMSKIQKQMSKLIESEPKQNKITIKISLVQYMQKVIQQLKIRIYQYNFYEMYKTVEILGKGASGTVFNIVNRESKKQYAGKIINKQKLLQEEGVSLEAIEYEILLMKQIHSKYVLGIVEVFEDIKYYYLILEIFFGGSLDNQLVKKQYFSISEVHQIMRGLLLAVKDLHDIKIMHRDIKPSNILLQDDDYSKIVLCDMGLATQVEVQPYLFQNVGTPGYVAPEVFFEEGKYSEICDLFSCGVVFYEILFNKMPWKSVDMEDVIEENKIGDINLQQTKQLMFGQGLYKEYELLEKMLSVDPKNRININEALEYPFLNTQKEDKIQQELKEVLGNDYVENNNNNQKEDLPKEVLEELKENDTTTQSIAQTSYQGSNQINSKTSNFNLGKIKSNNNGQSSYSLNNPGQSKFNLNKNLKQNQQRKTQIQIICEQNAQNKPKMSVLATPAQRQSIHQKYQIVMPKNSISYKRPTVMGKQILEEFDNKKINAIMEEDDIQQQIDGAIARIQQNQGNNSIIESEDDTDSNSSQDVKSETQKSKQQNNLQNNNNENKETVGGITDDEEKPPVLDKSKDIEVIPSQQKNPLSLDILTDDEQLSKRNNIRKFSPVLKNRVKNDQ